MTGITSNSVRPPDYPSVPLPSPSNSSAIDETCVGGVLDLRRMSLAVATLHKAQSIIESVALECELPRSFAFATLQTIFSEAIERHHGQKTAYPPPDYTGVLDARFQLVQIAETLIKCNVPAEAIKEYLVTSLR